MKIGEAKQARRRTVLVLLSGEGSVERSPCTDMVKTLPSPFLLRYSSGSHYCTNTSKRRKYLNQMSGSPR